MAKTMHRARTCDRSKAQSWWNEKKAEIRAPATFREPFRKRTPTRSLARTNSISEREPLSRRHANHFAYPGTRLCEKERGKRAREGGNFGDICPRILHRSADTLAIGSAIETPLSLRNLTAVYVFQHSRVCACVREKRGKREGFDPQYLSDSVIYFPTQFPS